MVGEPGDSKQGLHCEHLMENIKIDDGEPRCRRSAGSRWNVVLDNERMQ